MDRQGKTAMFCRQLNIISYTYQMVKVEAISARRFAIRVNHIMYLEDLDL